ncbi:helix-turn-helix domain-containing protein [Dactylosporangium sp. NPDC005572]|uniref:TetR/AcrR family transcriptional regulator n=1 Tax=Dactylosporangium sp. NPDC005572 TaxID=3156889 RepID=UPI0033B8A985
MAAERSATRAAIIAAAAELLDEGGARAVTTRAVAERAGVQAPVIYRLFGDKGGLVEAVAEAAMERYVRSKLTAEGATLDPVDALRAAWQQHVEFGLANPELYQLISRPGFKERAPATEQGIDVLRGLIQAMATAGVLVVPERRALEMLHAAGTGAVLALLSNPPHDRDLELPDAMLDAVLTAICRPPATHAPAHTLHHSTLVDELTGLTDAERVLLREWISRSEPRA